MVLISTRAQLTWELHRGPSSWAHSGLDPCGLCRMSSSSVWSRRGDFAPHRVAEHPPAPLQGCRCSKPGIKQQEAGAGGLYPLLEAYLGHIVAEGLGRAAPTPSCTLLRPSFGQAGDGTCLFVLNLITCCNVHNMHYVFIALHTCA